MIAKDITCQRFGKLVAMVRLPVRDKHKHSLWSCRCDCGTITTVTIGDLTTKNTESCGCGKYPPKKMRSMTRVFHSYKSNARYKRLEFDLTLSDFEKITQCNCHYCGALPSNIANNPIYKSVDSEYVYNGIDRVDNTKGYTLDSCVPCCHTCNWAKGKMPQEEFYHWIRQVSEYNFGGW